ncbi:carbonic anhydrase family protein [Acerihabitans sp. TG2]|uniref:carbonic anhydrase family protein n=1 Tax=Acerihabitans sp. TG2 TaxID=3096008 RepID=UPI002B23A346|nr:carbonic anhydrase family protein [Acerihabitans sp. TG2]MEA9391960.1 carbonic anhydrase family protein [Acerihabitans sp. TG2]
MMQKTTQQSPEPARRRLLKGAAGLSILGIVGMAALGSASITYAAAMTKEARDKLTPDQVIAGLKQGNIRFHTGKPQKHDYLAQKRASQTGQFPSVAILSCIDSRAPAEIVLDTGIGEAFNGRIAGNISNDDILGSLEFACAAAGAKVILVMGHTACGAVRGAIDNVELGHLTGLLNKIKPAIEKTEYNKERTGNNPEFVDAVAKTNVNLTIEEIRKSDILNRLEADGKIKIIGAMYNLAGGKVDFFA